MVISIKSKKSVAEKLNFWIKPLFCDQLYSYREFVEESIIHFSEKVGI
ncbi:hypothetical protein LEP1GSC018_2716 [Leptospira kirschneri str. 2008720114]|nr:hypothetical protein LEP1GSC018_2716 [Leptospira kirschneri str. 2008720114]